MNQDLTRIMELRQQLVKQGYYPFQIDSIFEDKIGHQAVEVLSHEESHSLVSYLEEYVFFAHRCKKLVFCSPVGKNINFSEKYI